MARRTVPASKPKDERSRIIERPDGFYWQAEDRSADFGPFPTLLEATVDMQATGDGTYEPGETLEEAEDEIGISNWIDPDTGEPAEESGPHIEEH